MTQVWILQNVETGARTVYRSLGEAQASPLCAGLDWVGAYVRRTYMLMGTAPGSEEPQVYLTPLSVDET